MAANSRSWPARVRYSLSYRFRSATHWM